MNFIRRRRKSTSDLYDNPNPTQRYKISHFVTQEMTDWQEGLNSVAQRDNYMLDREMFTDCTFTLGEGQNPEVQIKCHRLYLAKSSPVFTTMLFGELRKQDEVINLPDVNPEVFNMMLRYIYLDKVDLGKHSYEVVCGFLYVAKKYLLPRSLLAYIRAYLWHHIYPDNVWTAILFGQTNNEPELEKTAWQIVEQKTAKAIALEGFLEISNSTLLTLVQKPSLTCTEMQLVKACRRWAESEAKRQERIPDPIILRQILVPVVPHIRLDHKDLASDETLSYIFTTVGTAPVPGGEDSAVATSSSSKVSRTKPNNETFFVFGSPENELCELNEGDNIPISMQKNTSFVFGSSTFDAFSNDEEGEYEDKHQVGIKIPTQIPSGDNASSTYKESLTVLICKSSTSQRILKKFKFSTSAPYNSVLRIPFYSTVTIPVSKAIRINVIFHTTGVYPTFSSMEAHTFKKRKYPTFGRFNKVIECYEPSFKFIKCVVLREHSPPRVDKYSCPRCGCTFNEIEICNKDYNVARAKRW